MTSARTGPQSTAGPVPPAAYDGSVTDNGPQVSPAERGEFERIYKEAFPAMVSFGRRYVSEEDAEEVAHETLAGIWSRWDKIPAESRIQRFFLSAMHRRVLNERSSQNARAAALAKVGSMDATGHWTDDPTAAVEAWELAGIVDRAIHGMPEGRRLVWQLIRDDGMSYALVSKALSVSENTIRKHMSRALTDLREALDAAGYAPPGWRARKHANNGSEIPEVEAE